MAVTNIHPIKKTLNCAIEYIIDESKTDGKLLVTGNLCTPEIADIEFKAIQKSFGKDGKTLAHHIIQSFKPGEIDEKTAHEIGLKLLENLKLDSTQAVIATHINKGHIHNHVIFNSVSMDGVRYYNKKSNYYNIRDNSDMLCNKFGLSIIDTNKAKNERSKSKKVWQDKEKSVSNRYIIKNDIDWAISKSNDINEFINIMKTEKCYNIKKGSSAKGGEYISYKNPDAGRAVRDRTLGEEYRYENIIKRIELSKAGYNFKTIKSRKIYYTTKHSGINFKPRYYKRNISLANLVKTSVLILKLLCKRDSKNDDYSSYTLNANSKLEKLRFTLNLINKYKIKNNKDLDVRLSFVSDEIIKYKKSGDTLHKNIKSLKKVYKLILYFDTTGDINTQLKLKNLGLGSELEINDFKHKYENIEKSYNSINEKLSILEQSYNDLIEIKEEILILKNSSKKLDKSIAKYNNDIYNR